MGIRNKHITNEEINNRLFKVACIFWLIIKITGWRMWTTYRLFPAAPVAEAFDHIPAVIHTFLFGLSIVFILLLLFTNRNKFFVAGLLITELLWCLLDQNRWQPYEYQCLFIIFVFLVNKDEWTITTAIAVILTATYVYSGISKLNSGFLHTFWVPVVLKSFFKVPSNIAGWNYMYNAGYLSGLFELLGGGGLLFLKTRKAAALALISMHLFILLLLGPTGINYNIIVWPWNIVMMLYLYLVFLTKGDRIAWSSIFKGWNKLVFAAWCILPVLHFFGRWDNSLSGSMYEGRSLKMFICISDTTKCSELRPFFRNSTRKICKGSAYIELQGWALAETNVTPDPEIRVYRIIQKKLDQKYPAAGFSYLLY